MQYFLEHLNTQVPDLKWPKILPAYGASLLALVYQLEKTQTLPADWHRRQQLKQAAHLLEYASRNVPFYGSRGLKYNFDKELTYEQWSEVPILSRAELQQAGESMVTQNLPQNHGQIHTGSTSGSTGMPVTCHTTSVTNLMWFASSLLEHLWHERDFSGKHLAIRPDGKVPPGQIMRGQSWARPVQTGSSVMLNVRTDVDAQLQVIKSEAPDYLLSLPSNLKALAEKCRENNLNLESLKGVRSYGELLSAEVRAYCQETWGVKMTDVYSSQEIGNIAFQCPETENLHALTDSVFVEILNAEMRPCQPGEIGQVVVTSLSNFAAPLIRYSLGDYAEVGEPCGCRFSLPVLKRVLGRQRNMLHLPDGKTIWPTFAVREWSSNLPLKQFQFVQKELDLIEVKLVSERELTEEETEILTKSLHQRLTYPFRINITYLDSIPRSKSGKFEDFISEVNL